MWQQQPPRTRQPRTHTRTQAQLRPHAITVAAPTSPEELLTSVHPISAFGLGIELGGAWLAVHPSSSTLTSQPLRWTGASLAEANGVAGGGGPSGMAAPMRSRRWTSGALHYPSGSHSRRSRRWRPSVYYAEPESFVSPPSWVGYGSDPDWSGYGMELEMEHRGYERKRQDSGYSSLICTTSSPTSPTGPQSPPVEAPKGRKAIPCRFYHEGRCRYALEGKGDDCSWSHILPWDEATMGPLNKSGTSTEGSAPTSGPGSVVGAPNGYSAPNGVTGGPHPQGYGAPAPMVNGYGQPPHSQSGPQPVPAANGYYPPPQSMHEWAMYPPHQTYGAPPPSQPQQQQPQQGGGSSAPSGHSSPPASAGAPAQNGFEPHYYSAPYPGYPSAHASNGYGPPPPMPPYGYYPPPMPYGNMAPPPPTNAQPYGGMYGSQPSHPSHHHSHSHSHGGDQPMSPHAPTSGFGNGYGNPPVPPNTQGGSVEEPQQQTQQPDGEVVNASQQPYQHYPAYPLEPPTSATGVMPLDSNGMEAQMQLPKVNGHERTASLPHNAMFPAPPAAGPMPMRGSGRMATGPFPGRGGRGGAFGARGGRGGMRARYSTHDGGRLPTALDDSERGPRGPCSFFDRNACAFCDECLYAHVMPNGDDAREYGHNYAGPMGPMDQNARSVGGGRVGGRLPKPQDFNPRMVKGYDLWWERVKLREEQRRAMMPPMPATAAVVTSEFPPRPEATSVMTMTPSTADIRQRLDDVVQQRRDGTIPASRSGNQRPARGAVGGNANIGGIAAAARNASPSQRVPNGDDFPALEGTHRVALPTKVVEPSIITSAHPSQAVAPAVGARAPTPGSPSPNVDGVAQQLGQMGIEAPGMAKSGSSTDAGSTSAASGVSPAASKLAVGSWASAAARALSNPPTVKTSSTSPRRQPREAATEPSEAGETTTTTSAGTPI